MPPPTGLPPKARKIGWLKNAPPSAESKSKDDGLSKHSSLQDKNILPTSFAASPHTIMNPNVPAFIKQPQLRTVSNTTASQPANVQKVNPNAGVKVIEVILNDRLGKKVRVKCNSNDTVGDLKKLAAAQLGTRHDKIQLKKWYNIFKDHVRLDDYEIHDNMGIELYYL